ncbi:putative 3-demethylubiquinone-9 3-methyltransferase (glyoxalase superfamily) [Geomicrobium halophilum]|uniref:Putative 3-demethylubiquinone-9 3-methyltransferase (Glyoxalase superfamily) n=1 Tax=Geomicrobium halophilum TaxID=549000 RepID=A0A841PT48_9BACL|nr:putative 3-demethylubiquinone-9 3-methyltransferase (glyoxalase superfamily) [Geomicrobium halophilum]
MIIKIKNFIREFFTNLKGYTIFHVPRRKAEEAMNDYTFIIEDSKITRIVRYGANGLCMRSFH